MESDHGTRKEAVVTDPVRRFVELLDGSTIARVTQWPWSRAGYAVLKRLASDPQGYPDELLDALQAHHSRRVKIDAAREVTRRSVQLRNGPLLTLPYSVLAVLIAVVIPFVNTPAGPLARGLLSFGAILGVGLVVLLVPAFAAYWMSPYLTLLDALDDSLNRRPRRRTRAVTSVGLCGFTLLRRLSGRLRK